MSQQDAPLAAGQEAVARRSEHSGSPPGARGLRLGSAPTVSIVVASVGGRAALEACIETLLPTCAGSRIELVVVRSTSPDEFKDLQNRYRGALFMPAPDGSSARVLKNFGLAAADGDIVAFTDDAHPPDPEWLRHIVALTVPATPS